MYLSQLETRHSDLQPFLPELRFEWLAVESPRGWKQEVQRLAEGKDSDDLWLLSSFARNREECCGITNRQRRYAICAALTACDWDDPNVLRDAATYFVEVDEDQAALRAMDILLDRYGFYLSDTEEIPQRRTALLERIGLTLSGTHH
jgi:hypothetical protein